jgi:hypothetical protein
LNVFYWSPQHDWQAVNVSQKTGQKVKGPATSWQTPDGPYNVEHLAAMSPSGDLLVFYWSPRQDWQVVNVSQKTGQKVRGPATSWQTPDGPYNVEHLAAMSPSGDLLVFYWSPQQDWQVVNVSQKTGQRMASPATSWQTPDGPYNVEHLAAVNPSGDLLVFYWSPQHDWQAVNVSQKTGQKVRGPATSWQTPDGPYNVEHLAAMNPSGDLLVFYWSPRQDWQVVNVSQKTEQRVASAATSWQTPDGPYNVEHLAAVNPSGDQLVFYWSPQHDWQAVNVSQKTQQRAVGLATSWQTHDLPRTVGVLTQHNNNFRTGVQPSETILTPAAVNLHGMHLKYPPLEVDDPMDTQPLYVRSVPFSAGSANAFFVATSNNSVYAFDADRGDRKWLYQFADTDHSQRSNAHDLPATPVIDSKSNTLYIVFSTENFGIDTSNLNPDQAKAKVLSLLPTFNVAYWLVALNLGTGRELRRTQLQGTAAVTNGSTQSLDLRWQLNHPALLLDHGSIYVGFGSNPGWEWFTDYHGWVLRYDADTFQQKGTFCTTPAQANSLNEGGGVWQGGGGLAADADGSIYFLVGNAPVDATSRSVGDSFVKLTPAGNTLAFAGFYPVPEEKIMDEHDLDLGSGGLFVVPGTKILVGGGKTGMVYGVNGNFMNIRGNAGQLDSYQAFTNTYHPDWNYGCPMPRPISCQDWESGPHLHGSPIYWNGNVYAWSEKDHLKRFGFGVGKIGTWTFTKTPVIGPVRATATMMPGGLSSLSANGNDTGSGIVWSTLPSIDRSLLYAFDAETLHVIWQSWFPDVVRFMSHRGGPTIADGKVAIPTSSNALLVYELRSSREIASPPVPVLQPVDPPDPAAMAMHTMRFDASLQRVDRIAPPADQIVLFRLWARVEGEREQFDGGHRIGGRWESGDGSSITAEPVKSAAGPNLHAPAWQLFKVTEHRGKGRFDSIEWIQRVDTTTGGATYIFYGKKS